MDAFAGLLLPIWREVSRHIEIEESIPRLAPLIRERLPADRLTLLRVDVAHSRLECAAMDEPPGRSADTPRQRHLEEKELADLLAWCHTQTVSCANTRDSDQRLIGLLRTANDSSVLAGPLVDGEGVHGVFVAAADRANVFNEEHVALVKALLEPLTVALHNDRRVAEITALREAAEADKISLLRRLGREGLSDTIVGAESGLKAVMERVNIVAPSDLPVLILGETGSGKEVIARAIHERSPRCNGPFLRVNCGAIPSELIDSELFGHEKGSFTGAAAQRKGWFERADTGTLFLDEVGEMSQAAQVRLLRVLQDGTFERVGGHQPLTVDVRVIAATHPNLQAKVADGRFREDLWYRVAVFPIELPPLSDRRQDIPTLANHCAQRAARRFGFRPLTVMPRDLPLLLNYSWPGNVRELAAVMDRAVILGQGKTLEVAKALGMPLGPKAEPKPGPGDRPSPVITPGTHVAFRQPSGHLQELDGMVRGHIEQVLASTQGKIEGPQGAAKILGINPHTLRARMRKLGIDWSHYRAQGQV